MCLFTSSVISLLHRQILKVCYNKLLSGKIEKRPIRLCMFV